MILYYAPGAGSQAAHILLQEAKVPFSLERVNLSDHICAGGDNYTLINPKRYVPALKLPDGDVLTELAVILQYIADEVPHSRLLPPLFTRARYHAMEMLNFIATEIHKNFITHERHGGVAANFLSKTHEGQALSRVLVSPRLSYLDVKLANQQHLLSEHFSACDAYLYTMLNWAKRIGIDLIQWPNLSSYHIRLSQRPSIVKALQREGPPHVLLEKN